MAYRISCILLLLFLFLSIPTSSSSQTTTQINSNSILIALLDSHYTELTYLIEKANLLQTLENTVSKHNITIFAPNNVALERNLDPDFKHFLLQPGNILSLQTLLLSHVIPTRILSGSTRFKSISNHHLHLETNATTGQFTVNQEKVTHPNDINRPDGVIHGIQKLLIPRAVVDDFNNRRSLRSITAVKPEGAPEVDVRKIKKSSPEKKPGSAPAIPIYEALAPGPSLAPAPAPGPGGPHHHFNGELQVKDFIKTLLHYGGYNEMADILVNLTSLATEMSRLVSEGYVLTVLAPNDEAMAKLTTEELSEPGSPEEIMYYHIIPEYQTEESMYNAVRRFGKVSYETLRLKYKIVAQEADGSVKFGDGDGSGYLFDPDIYTDGRISVQGIDGVLFPVKDKEVVPQERVKPISMMGQPRKGVVEHRRGKLLETACWMLGTFSNHSRFTSCQ